MKPKIPNQITEKDIKENLKRVENGEALTIPLAVLDGVFKEAYKKEYGEFERQSPEEVKASWRKYQKSDKYKAYRRKYDKSYLQKPEVKARRRIYMREYKRRKHNIPKSKWRVK